MSKNSNLSNTNIFFCLIVFVIIIILYFIVNKKISSVILNQKRDTFKLVHIEIPKEHIFKSIECFVNQVGEANLFNINVKNPEKEVEGIFNYISPNIEDISEENIFLNGFKTCITKDGDSIFLRNFKNGSNDDKIKWMSKNIFIKNRITKNVFLKREDDLKNNIIISRYLINEIPTVHINYNFRSKIKKKNNAEAHILFTEENIKVFTQFVKFAKDYFQKNQIVNFTISGSLNFSSVIRDEILKRIFGNQIIVSPNTNSNFYQRNKKKCSTTDFIIFSKAMAPNGVYFYLTELAFVPMPNSYVLVAEVLNDKNMIKKEKNDYTDLIFEIVKEKKNIYPDTIIDKTRKDNIDIESIINYPSINFVPF